jgi:6-pyruvoyltetrahydropterin/6-carboxytetrahydropterin synthase
MLFATIAKTFTFDAAHRLDRLPEHHKCHRMHGHTYEVEIQLLGLIDEQTGMIVDYADIALAYEEEIHAVLDHRTLNDIAGLEVPTTEVLVHWIIDRLMRSPRLRGPSVQTSAWPQPVATSWLSGVLVRESSTTWCEASAYNVAGIHPWCMVAP